MLRSKGVIRNLGFYNFTELLLKEGKKFPLTRLDGKILFSFDACTLRTCLHFVRNVHVSSSAVMKIRITYNIK